MDDNHATPLVQLAINAAQIEQRLMSADDPEKVLSQILDQINQDLIHKADHYHFAMKHLKAVSDMLKSRASEFSDASRLLDNAQDKMKDRIKTAMQIMKTSEIKGHDVVFKLSGMNRKLVISQEKLDINYLMAEMVYKPNKEQIEEDLDKGLVIEGVQVIESPTLRMSVNKGKVKP
jgi:hypothetical protein